ncbi:hypothetical protein [Paraburkholderia youngii]|uniref:hypothetical protein n=1 Tax=Paraburkholderia youngii TaxID=2782701 RepID=UPI003D1BA27E
MQAVSRTAAAGRRHKLYTLQRNHLKKLHQLALALALALAASAASAATAHATEVYSQVGTGGIGIGAGISVTSMANVRAEFNGFAFSKNFSAGDLDYDGNVTLAHAGLFAGFFPAPSVVPFHLTAGLLIGNDNVSGDASPTNNTFTINGVTVSGDDEKIHARVKLPTVRPYVGIGFGHSPVGKAGFSMFCDLGVAYGKPQVDFNVPADVAAAAGPENVAAQADALRQKAERYKWYPYAQTGVRYKF